MRPDVVVESLERERNVEHETGLGRLVGVDVPVLDAEEERGTEGECDRGENVAADRALVAVDAGGEGGVVACSEGVGGVGEEGGNRSGAAKEGGALQRS